MKTIAQLIDDKSKELNIQIASAKPMKEEAVSWLKAKEYVDSLKSNYRDLVTELLNTGWKFGKKKIGKKIFNQFSRHIEGYEVLVEIREDEGAVTRVIYYAFSNNPMNAYVREIVGKLSNKEEK